ncbi:MAG: rod-binding protein [Thermoguttaceae bacterium]|jgi:Rod binding domain-containing protein
MQINAAAYSSASAIRAYQTLNAAKTPANATDLTETTDKAADNEELRGAFNDFVGQTFFSQMLQSMRKTVGKSAYFNGGRAEEIFTGQLDQVLAEKMSTSCAEKFTDPMYELFTAQRR